MKTTESPMLAGLRQRLHDCGKTQMEIAAGSGVAQSIVSRVMRGVLCRMSNFEALTAYVDGVEASARRSRRGRPRTPIPVIDQGDPGAAALVSAMSRLRENPTRRKPETA